jgi:hypothetical protein
MEEVMSAGYVIARENFKEAARHVSAEKDPVMFNLLYGLQSLTNQIESDFEAMRTRMSASAAQPPSKAGAGKAKAKPASAKRALGKKAGKKAGNRPGRGK